MKLFNAKNAPNAVGPYSHAVILKNGFIYVSGQIGFDAKTMEIPSDVEQQAKNVLKNIDAILTEAGYNNKDIVKTTIFLKDMSNFEIVNNIYGNYFGDHKPARSTVEVAKLPKNGLIEIEVVAYHE
ncbi:RidA family protein [Williamsoniiplasma luminosum]|uniref:Reactive intermediate/imine deaminase n=1 Tax=Williamsoniiplasma luminosum TaxID=214888 RepID=A0A2S0NKM0_9MOLU|nr:Rid family detoxifying hydrolase [Williamsoniiplasma luminosum]AVP49561.1 MAG: reactive intermediate/imine deaminase [Williamsoniiplasma luminosum]